MPSKTMDVAALNVVCGSSKEMSNRLRKPVFLKKGYRWLQKHFRRGLNPPNQSILHTLPECRKLACSFYIFYFYISLFLYSCCRYIYRCDTGKFLMIPVVCSTFIVTTAEDDEVLRRARFAKSLTARRMSLSVGEGKFLPMQNRYP